jgi:hypothetical protein
MAAGEPLETNMDELTILRTMAACATVLAAEMVAASLNPRITVAGFGLFINASIAWTADGLFESKSSLVIQNLILLLLNVLGVWRWLPRAEKEAGLSEQKVDPAFIRKHRDGDNAARAAK